MEAQSKKQQEQLERLRKDMGAVDMTTTPSTGRPMWKIKQDLLVTRYFTGITWKPFDRTASVNGKYLFYIHADS